jgi:hypothetical protein
MGMSRPKQFSGDLSVRKNYDKQRVFSKEGLHAPGQVNRRSHIGNGDVRLHSNLHGVFPRT